MNFDSFLTGEYYDMQQELHGRVAALPAELKRDWQAKCVLSGTAVKYNQPDAHGTIYAPGAFDGHIPEYWQGRFQAIHETAVFERAMQPVYEFNEAAIKITVDIDGFTSALEKFGLELDELSSSEQQRQYDVSDWLFTLLYTNRLEDTRLWWLGYWPARAWEHVVLMLPVSWFRKRSKEE